MKFARVIKFLAVVLIFAAVVSKPLGADEPAALARPSLSSGGALSADELASIMGLKIWKLNVTVPEGSDHVTMKFVVREKGVAQDKPFGGIMSCPFPNTNKKELSLIISLAPVDGAINDADKLRLAVAWGGSTASSLVDNSLKGLNIGNSAIPDDNKDGTFNLIGGMIKPEISFPLTLKSDGDRMIVLKIETSKKQ